jgi:hypothetical protein
MFIYGPMADESTEIDFETAEKEFDAVQRADPYRMEEVDIYSNMLYVMDKRAKLGKLAHEYAEIDRNRAEVCCLIGALASAAPTTAFVWAGSDLTA